MITLEFDLITNTYGASPWQDSSYSGTVEVPPSPVRILRSIAAGMFRHLDSLGLRPLHRLTEEQIKKNKVKVVKRKPLETDTNIEVPEEWMTLLKKIASVSPSFYIPPFTMGGHKFFTPQQRPGPDFGKNEERLRIIYDSYIIFDEDNSSIFCQYDIELNQSEKELLKLAIENIDYLGRSEYTCDVVLIEGLPDGKEINCYPDASGLISSIQPTGEEGCVDWLLKSTKQVRCEGYAINPGLRYSNYTLIEQKVEKKRNVSSNQYNTYVYDFNPDSPVNTRDGLFWTDLLHKALVSRNPDSIKFVGHDGDTSVPADQRIWYYWNSDNNGRIKQLVVQCRTPFTKEEFIAFRDVRDLYTQNNHASVILLGMKNEVVKPSTTFKTITPMLCYTSPRKNKNHRSPQVQALNSFWWNFCDETEKLEEVEVNGDTATAIIPDIGRVTVTLTSVVQNVVAQRGNRRSPVPVGFNLEIECENPVAVSGIGYNRQFGSGRLTPV